MTEKTRRFYTFCDVQAGQRFTKNTSKHLDDTREIEAPNHLLYLFEAGIELALKNESETRRCKEVVLFSRPVEEHWTVPINDSFVTQ